MKKNYWKKVVTLLALSVAMLTFGLQVAKADESSITVEIESFQEQLNSELSQVNAIYTKASDSQAKLKTTNKKIEGLSTEITKAEEKYDSLKERRAEQMRAIQANGGVSTSVLDILLNATDFHEAVQALANLRVILRAEDEQAQDLVDTQKNLETMQAVLSDAKDELEKAQNDYRKQVESLEGRIASLKDRVADNQELLAEMQHRAAKDQKEASSPRDESLSVSTDKGVGNAVDDSTITTPNGEAGSTLTVSATAYSSDNGLGHITATGINLHQNPMCIAVDPSVIPLGSMVEVPGYGIAIAGDTGGAVVGNIIDVHLPTTAQAISWGRQTLQVNVLG